MTSKEYMEKLEKYTDKELLAQYNELKRKLGSYMSNQFNYYSNSVIYNNKKISAKEITEMIKNIDDNLFEQQALIFTLENKLKGGE